MRTLVLNRVVGYVVVGSRCGWNRGIPMLLLGLILFYNEDHV